jgi:hypothetical protein
VIETLVLAGLGIAGAAPHGARRAPGPKGAERARVRASR